MRLFAAVMIAGCALAGTTRAAAPPASPSPTPGPAAAAGATSGPVAAKPAVPAPAPPRPVYRPVEFGRLVAELPAGTPWMDIEYGPMCIPRGNRVAAGGREKVELRDAKALFRREITRAGLKADGGGDDDLFGPAKAGDADFIVSGKVVLMHETVCFGSSFDQSEESGHLSMTVDWELFSKSRSEVVAKARTSVMEAMDSRPGGAATLLNNAFAESVSHMAANPAIRRALAVQPAAAVQQAQLPASQPPLGLEGSLTAAPHGVNVEADSVVLISTGEGTGSGFLVSKDGYLLTDQHVVGDAKTVKIRWSDGVEAEAVVVRQDRGRDVALLKADPRGHAPLPLRKDIPVRGDTIFAIGAPLGEQYQGTVMRGVISASRVVDGYDMLQGDANVNHGMSGGPVLDERGRVVALVEAGLQRYDYISMGINYFTPIGDALRYLSLTPQ